jgi:HSP20 family molecular chaperone IbpA
MSMTHEPQSSTANVNTKGGAPSNPSNPKKQRTERIGVRTVAPPVDVYENRDELVLVADVPGISADSLELRIEKEVLTLEAKRPQLGDGSDGLRFDYERRFFLPRGLDPEKVEATVARGVVTICLRKAETAKPRRIQVRSA